MKRFSVLTAAMALAAVVLTGCEDVPSPFGTVTPPSQTTPASDMPTVGTGVVTDPYNVQAVLEYVKSLGADVESPEEVYVKGIVTSISEISTQYGNASFVLSDDADGSNKFYRVKGFGNQKVSDENIVKIGDEVIVCGKVVYYRGNTPETVQNSSYVYSVNGNTGGGQTPTPTPTVEAKGSGTQADPYNVQAVYNIVSALAADTDTEAEYYVKGTVKSIPSNGISTQYNNVSFYLTDDGSNEFYIFRAKGLNGGDVTENMLKVGDEVVVFCSKWVNYKGNTPETKQGEAYIVSITAGSGSTDPSAGGGTVTDSGYEITLSDFSLGNGVDLTTLTATDGTELTFAQEGGSNSPKYYTSGTSARMYALNSLTISGSKTMTKVILTCAMNGSNAANGNDLMYGEADGQKVTVSKDSNTQVSFSGFSSKTLKIVNDYTQDSAGTQLRIQKITIVYAD